MSRRLTVRPLTADRWDDLARLFGPRGAHGGCWCMWWRLRASEFDRRTGAENRRSLRRRMRHDPAPGLIGYMGDEPVAWVSLGPREAFPGLEYSRRFRRVDQVPVWSIVCFFVDRSHRCQGLMRPLIEAAAGYARRHGACRLEAYPIERQDELKGSTGYTGVASVFRRLGFRRVALRDGRLILRRRLSPTASRNSAGG